MDRLLWQRGRFRLMWRRGRPFPFRPAGAMGWVRYGMGSLNQYNIQTDTFQSAFFVGALWLIVKNTKGWH